MSSHGRLSAQKRRIPCVLFEGLQTAQWRNGPVAHCPEADVCGLPLSHPATHKGSRRVTPGPTSPSAGFACASRPVQISFFPRHEGPESPQQRRSGVVDPGSVNFRSKRLSIRRKTRTGNGGNRARCFGTGPFAFLDMSRRNGYSSSLWRWTCESSSRRGSSRRRRVAPEQSGAFVFLDLPRGNQASRRCRHTPAPPQDTPQDGLALAARPSVTRRPTTSTPSATPRA